MGSEMCIRDRDPRTVEPCGGQPGAGGHQLAHWRPGAEGAVPASDAGGTDENSACGDRAGLNAFGECLSLG